MGSYAGKNENGKINYGISVIIILRKIDILLLTQHCCSVFESASCPEKIIGATGFSVIGSSFREGDWPINIICQDKLSHGIFYEIIPYATLI